MSDERYERLSSVDAAFLEIETGSAHMHVGGVLILDGSTVASPNGGIEFRAVRDQLARTVKGMPRMRQRLRQVHGVHHWVWVDDPHFNVDFHIRHTALPRPGGEAELECLAGRIFSQRLDRERPLWEFWVVEGLTDERFALIIKVHHCMLDGMGAVNLLTALASPPSASSSEIRPEPSGRELAVDEVRRRLAGWRELTRAAGSLVAHPLKSIEKGASNRGWLERIKGVQETLKSGLRAADRAPINPDTISPHRRFAMMNTDLADVKRVKNKLGGTVNDVVLATVTGALRRYLLRRDVDVDVMEHFRALVPASVRRPAGAGDAPQLGNQVSLLLVPLPIAKATPVERLSDVREFTTWLKTESHEADGVEWMEHVDDRLGLGLVTSTLKLAMTLRSFNVVITNVPGPPFPIDLAGSPLQSIHAMVPLFHHQGLGVALFSYNGTLHWGVAADWEAVPDVHEFIDDLQTEFAALAAHAE